MKREDLPRWFLSHRDVEVAYNLIRNLGYKIPDDVPDLNAKMKALKAKGRNPIIDDYSVLELYTEIIQAKEKLSDRRGNWAQPFFTDRDGQIFVTAQFLRHLQASDEVTKGPLAAMRQKAKRGENTK